MNGKQKLQQEKQALVVHIAQIKHLNQNYDCILSCQEFSQMWKEGTK